MPSSLLDSDTFSLKLCKAGHHLLLPEGVDQESIPQNNFSWYSISLLNHELAEVYTPSQGFCPSPFEVRKHLNS